jgi:hypothetical protein
MERDDKPAMNPWDCLEDRACLERLLEAAGDDCAYCRLAQMDDEDDDWV